MASLSLPDFEQLPRFEWTVVPLPGEQNSLIVASPSLRDMGIGLLMLGGLEKQHL